MESKAASSVPRHSATVLLLRAGGAEGGGEPEVLLLRRHRRSGFAADAWVFPGGVLDEADMTLPADCWSGIDPQALAPRFGAPPELVLGLHVAAVRETFEEALLLLASHADGSRVDLVDAEVRRMRASLADRSTSIGAPEFASWVRSNGLVLDLGALHYWAHWITPRIEPRRYNTRFFLARAPEGQVSAHDEVEITDQRWVRAAEALEAAEAGELSMMPPTLVTLEQIREVRPPTLDAVVEHAAAREEVPAVLPHFERHGDGDWRVLLPGNPEYPMDLYRDELERERLK